MRHSAIAAAGLLFVVGSLSCGSEPKPSEFVTLEGPFPMAVRGELKLTGKSEMDEGEYMLDGWIATEKGAVAVHGPENVLSIGGAARGGKVNAMVQPDDETPGSYFIVGVVRIE